MKAGTAYAPEQEMLGSLIASMNLSRQGFALFDETDTLRYANQAFRGFLDLDSSEQPAWVEMMRKGFERSAGTNIVTRDFERWLASAKSRRGKLPFRTIETDLSTGQWVLTTETMSHNGWMLCVVTDVSELGTDWRSLRQERDLALKAAMTDELTGLSNRRYLTQHLESVLGPHKAASVTIVLLDLDYFKRINDRLGHDVGDVVLRHFALQLQSHVRRDDLAGRMGGEEFLVALNGVDPDGVRATLDRMLGSVRASRPLAEEPDFAYTCSAGVAVARPGEPLDELLRRADLAMYKAKAEGRDRYVFSGEE